MAKTKTNDVLPMSDKLKTVRDALESCTIAKDRGMSWLHYDQTKVAAALAALSSMEAEAGEVAGLTEHFTYIFDDEEIVAMSEAAAGYRWMEDTKQFDLCAKAMKKVLMQWRDSFHPKAQEGVELTEEEVERTAKDNTDYSKDHPHHFREGFKSCLRHLCSKYHLIPRKP